MEESLVLPLLLRQNVEFWSDPHLERFIECLYQEWKSSSYLSGQAFFDQSTHLELNVTLQNCLVEANSLNIPSENRNGWFEELIQYSQEQAFMRSLNALQKELTKMYGLTVDPTNDHAQQILNKYQTILQELKKLKTTHSISSSISSEEDSLPSFSKGVS